LRRLSALFFLYSLFVVSQTKITCEQWNRSFSKIDNFDDQLKFCQKSVPQVDKKCAVEIYTTLADIYADSQKQDSANFYFDKAELLSKKLNQNELIAYVLSKKANYLTGNDYNLDKATKLLEEAKKLFSGYKQSEKKLDYYDAKASLEDQKGNYNLAINYCDSVIIFEKKRDKTVELGWVYHNKGVYYFNLSEYEKAVKNLLYAAQLKEKLNENDTANTYYVLGSCYESWGFLDTSAKYYEKAITSSKKKGYEYVQLVSYIGLAGVYRDLKKHDLGLKTINAALSILNKNENPKEYSQILCEKGWILLEKDKDFFNAEKNYLEAHKYALLSEDDDVTFYNLQSLLLFYIKNRDFKKAKPFISLLEEVATRCNTVTHDIQMHKLLWKYYDGIGDYKSSYVNLKKFYRLDDSINKISIKTKVADLEKKYDTQKKELTISNLSKKQVIQKAEIEKSKFRQMLYLSLFLLLLGLLIAGLLVFKKLQKQKEQLAVAHNELTVSNEKLNELNTIKNRLFSIISHDLRSMLIPFQRSGKLLKHFVDTKEEKLALQLATELDKNSHGLSNSLDNLLNWSLEQMNGYKSKPVEIVVKKELEEIISVYQQQAHYKNTSIKVIENEEVVMLFDKGAFHVIFRNLIGNAIKYTQNGEITVLFERNLNEIHCSVSDTGVGMTDAQVKNAFNLDENKSNAGTQGEKGTGIGLNLVHRFVTIHKGTIRLVSEIGKGTKFEMTFPITTFNEK
jgi:signal transduction histidine kinase